MRKTIKSGSEIRKEIGELFENYKNDAELLERIHNYIKNLTGKELYPKMEIAYMVRNELASRACNKKIVLEEKGPIVKLEPSLNSRNLKKIRKNRNMIDAKFKEREKIIHASIIFGKITNNIEHYKSDSYKEYIYPHNKIYDYIENNSVVFKLNKFLIENDDVAKLLIYHINNTVRESIIDLVITKIIPLKVLLIYFDNNKTVKQNTVDIFKLCRGQIPKLNIQQVITDNIKYLRSGSYHFPFIFTEIDPHG